jgi:hypothetical protein
LQHLGAASTGIWSTVQKASPRSGQLIHPTTLTMCSEQVKGLCVEQKNKAPKTRYSLLSSYLLPPPIAQQTSSGDAEDEQSQEDPMGQNLRARSISKRTDRRGARQ